MQDTFKFRYWSKICKCFIAQNSKEDISGSLYIFDCCEQ